MSRPRWTLTLTGLLFAVGLGCGGLPEGVANEVGDGDRPETEREEPSATPARGRSAAVGLDKITLMHDGEERFAYVHIPADYDASHPVPLLLAFHGGKGRGHGAKAFARVWQSQFDRSMIFVFPNGQDRDPSDTSWQSRDFSDTRDVELIKAILKRVSSRYAVDPERVFVAGFSNGGLMTTLLACHAPELFAGFAIFSQTVHRHVAAQCAPSLKRPVLYLAGTNDSHWPGRHFSHSAMESVAWWRDTLGCSTEPRKVDINGSDDGHSVQRWTFAPCEGATAFEFLRVENGEHIWPGSDLPQQKTARCTDIEGSAEVLDFFRRRAGL